jgi:hypothetical protein
MTIETAYRFMDRSRSDERVRERIALLGADPSLEDLVQLAQSLGMCFSAQDLREAFRQDWTLRWLAGASATGTAPEENRAASARASAE